MTDALIGRAPWLPECNCPCHTTWEGMTVNHVAPCCYPNGDQRLTGHHDDLVAARIEIAQLRAENQQLTDSLLWWVRTDQIHSDQYRAFLGYVDSMRESAERLAASFQPKMIDTYVNKMVPRA